MSWRFPDKCEFVDSPCCTRRKLYGGIFKNQRQHFQEIPLGTLGTARQRITEGETGIEYYLCTFRLGSQRLWVRCPAAAIELEPPGGDGVARRYLFGVSFQSSAALAMTPCRKHLR